MASHIADNVKSQREAVRDVWLLKVALEGFNEETTLYHLELDDVGFNRLRFLGGKDRGVRQGVPILNSASSFSHGRGSEKIRGSMLYSYVTNWFSRVLTWAYRSLDRYPLRMTLLVMLVGYGVALAALLASIMYRGELGMPELPLTLAGATVTFVHWSLARFQRSSLAGQVLNVGCALTLVCYVAFLISELLSVQI